MPSQSSSSVVETTEPGRSGASLASISSPTSSSRRARGGRSGHGIFLPLEIRRRDIAANAEVRGRRAVYPGAHPSPGPPGDVRPWPDLLGEFVGLRPVAFRVSRCLVVECVCAAAVDRDDVVDHERPRVGVAQPTDTCGRRLRTAPRTPPRAYSLPLLGEGGKKRLYEALTCGNSPAQ